MDEHYGKAARLGSLHELKVKVCCQRRSRMNEIFFLTRSFAREAEALPAAMGESPFAVSASASGHSMFCREDRACDKVLLPAPFGPQTMIISGMGLPPEEQRHDRIFRPRRQDAQRRTYVFICIAQRSSIPLVFGQHERLHPNGGLQQFLHGHHLQFLLGLPFPTISYDAAAVKKASGNMANLTEQKTAVIRFGQDLPSLSCREDRTICMTERQFFAAGLPRAHCRRC